MSTSSTTLVLDNLPVVAVTTVAAGVIGSLYLFKLIKALSSTTKAFLPRDDFTAVPLIRKEILSHDTRKFTFGLPQSDQVLGLPIGQHVSLQYIDKTTGKAVQRSYTPVTDDTVVGEFSLVIKVYRPLPPKFPVGGLMSQHLDDLQIGDTINMRGPKGHLHWIGGTTGQFHVKPLGKPAEDRNATQIGMMAGGTGITPMLQILHAIFKSNNQTSNKYRVKLIYANQTVQDILVRQELEQLQQEFPDQFQLWYTVDRLAPDDNEEEKTWKYDTGFIGTTMIQKHLLFDNNNNAKTQFFMCGPPPMIKFACLPALQECGFSEKDWVVF